MSFTPYPPPHVAASATQPMPPIPRVSRGRMMRRGAQRFVRGIGNGLRMVFDGRPILVLCFILLLTFFGWLTYDRFFAASSSASSPNGPLSIVKLPEPPVVQQYIMAVQKGDSDAAWNTLSASEKARRVAQSEDKTVLAQILQAEQQSKMGYTAFHYVGSFQEGDSSRPTFYFYVGDIGSGTQKRQLPLMFAVSKSGMILYLQDRLYDTLLAQLKGGP